MRAILLSAGSGVRLREGFDDPKCLISIGGRCLLRRYLESFSMVGIEEMVVVLGYRMERVLEYMEGLPAGPRVHILRNTQYERRSILSLWTARDWLRDEILLMDSDIFFEEAFLKKPAKSKKDNFFFIDSRAVNDGEAVMVGFKDGKAVDLSRGLHGGFDLMGEWAGGLKLSPAGTSLLREILCQEVAQGNVDEGYEFVVPQLFDRIPITYELIDHLKWVEIDFPEDMEKAEKLFRSTKWVDEGLWKN